ncbi:hypothetical protein CO037_00110 [Candidatus Pacearchaeota archaeon CG_4_9_14_0_2_um_filter_30_8]|nr:MAG: hypothetical protein CO037_00110 [Candidatus Pacearchaeota archaeon CG_4_9_14_0_2_um_filter_30_8]
MKKTIINLLLLGTLALPINNLVGNFEKNITHNKPNYTLFLDAEKTEMQRMSKENLNQIFQNFKKQNLEDRIIYEGGMKIKLVNENKEIKIPSWKRLGVEGEDMCSQYARKLASRLGYNLNIWGETWNLYKNNPWVPFSEDSLKRGYLVTLFNPTSKYNKKGRKETHTAVYLGKDEQGKMYIAEQRGNKTKISTTEEIKKDGMTPVRIIKTEKKSL